MRMHPGWFAILLLAGSVPAMSTPLSEPQLAVLRQGQKGPNEAAAELARKIGRDADVDGLRAIAQLRSPYLLWQAQQSFNVASHRTLPEPLEALIVEHYADPELHRPLLAFLARDVDQNGRYPRYSGRKLFELLYADTQTAGADRLFHAIRLVATDLAGVEPLLVEALPALDAATAGELVSLLGQRRYGPAVPALRALQARISFAQDVNGLLAGIDRALLRIGTAEAHEVLLQRLTALGRMSEPQAGSEIWIILLVLSDLPAGSAPDYATLRAVLPTELNASAQAALVRLIANRRETRGVPDLIRMLPSGDAALDALLALGSAADWRTARTEIARLSAAGQISGERERALLGRLDSALADPGRFAAEQRLKDRYAVMQKARDELNREHAALQDSRRTDPRAYLAARREQLARLEQLWIANQDLPAASGLRDELGRAYSDLGHFARYKAQDARQAIALYGSASQWAPSARPLHLLAVADTYRFDLKQPREAVARYRELLAYFQQASGSDKEPPLRDFATAWLPHEIEYLETGKLFAGPLKREDAARAQLWFFLTATFVESASYDALPEAIRAGDRAKPEVQQALSTWLKSLPASQWHLHHALAANGRLPDAEIQHFLSRHDPAGYLSASLLSIVILSAESTAPGSLSRAGDPALAKAQAQRLLLQSRVTADLAADVRLGSPEKTWQHFTESARRGDAQGMLSCLTGEAHQQWEKVLPRMTGEQLAEMATSVQEFKLASGFGEFREAVIVRRAADGRKIAGVAYFVNQGGEWKIQSM